jgi:hypothetical protein
MSAMSTLTCGRILPTARSQPDDQSRHDVPAIGDEYGNPNVTNDDSLLQNATSTAGKDETVLARTCRKPAGRRKNEMITTEHVTHQIPASFPKRALASGIYKDACESRAGLFATASNGRRGT